MEKINKKQMDIDIVKEEEMQGFIEGLFDQQNPKVDPSLDLRIPTVESVKDKDVEFVSKSTVNKFILGLFEKE